ncbi:MAG: M28 family peptidase [Anaerovoracaceae bacterium]|jgi:Iap family predicted aminopeptidase
MNLILEQDIKKFIDAVDVSYQVDFVREYSQIGDSALYGGKHCGSDAEHEGSRFIAGKLKEIGVSNVELIPCRTSRYQFNDATLTVDGEHKVIKPYGYVSPGTAADGISGELVDAVKCRKEDLQHIDIGGRIVIFAAMGTLEGANLSGQIEMAMKYGARAVIIYAVEDVLNDETIRVQPPNVICRIPVVGICSKDALWLQKKIAEGDCRVKLNVDADFIPGGGTTYNVVGEIPGKMSDERIIYTAHLDHYFRCLQDNMSTCSTLLGIAKAIIDSGYTPNRTITFAFHGSHETGGMGTRYPYILGSYRLTHEAKKEWTGRAIANINFEYTALKMKKLQALAYMGVNDLLSSYYPYSPELTGRGFKEKMEHGPETEYYMFSWSDSVSYHSSGIPVITNDPISEQYYEGTGPYVGRDHSNFDNWDVFDEGILEEVSRYYGGLGLYLDSMPYLCLDFSEQADRIKREVDRGALDALGIDSEEYFAALDQLATAAKEVKTLAENGNAAYIEALSNGLREEEKRAWFGKSRALNSKLLKAYKVFADDLDRYNAEDFICLATVKYLGNAAMLQAAGEALSQGNIDKAAADIMPVDLVASSFYFDEDVVEHMRKQICDPEFADRRTWARGRESHVFTYYDLVKALKTGEKNGEFTELHAKIDEAIAREAGCIPQAMEGEKACIRKVTAMLEDEI